MKTKQLGWKENHEIENICIEDSQENIATDQRQVLKNWEKCITELYNRANRTENVRKEEEIFY